MLLAEALAARKQALNDVTSLSGLVQTNSVRYDDVEKPKDEADPLYLRGRLDGAIEDYGRLSVAINKTNNVTTIAFDGRNMTIMEAVSFREVLLFKAKHYRAIADAAQEAINPKRRYGEKRTKDDVKQVADIDHVALRNEAGAISQQLRRLDSALQQANWTTTLVE